LSKRNLRLIALLLVGCFMFTALSLNALVAEAATKMSSSFGNVLLSKKEVGQDVYLKDVITLNNNESFVGIFVNPSDYEFYYGESKDMVNWNLTSKYFSLVYGNGAFVGISSGQQNKLQYTKGGQEWKAAALPADVNPMAVKYENGYFKLSSKDADNKTSVYLSKDAEVWFDITNDVPAGAKVEDIVTKDGAIYSIVGTSISGDSVKVYSASSVNESSTKWSEIETLKKAGYGLEGNFFFNGKTVGVQLYSLADYNKNGYVSDKLYYITNDFVNWEEKDWTIGNEYYSAFSSTSTEIQNTAADSKRFEAVEVLPYKDSQTAGSSDYFVSSVVHSKDGTTWLNEIVNIFVNGEKVSRDPQTKTSIEGLEKFEWARSGAEYVLGRNYLSTWEITPFEESITRGEYLTLIMKALNVQEPAAPRSGYIPFEDVWGSDSLIQRANRLGLTSGVGNNQFAPDESITRQDMMVLTFNILSKLGKIEPDTELTSLNTFKDKDNVKDYAKLAVSSLIKASIITGDGVNVYPLNNVTNAEGTVIAKSLNTYRFR
jgi:hypothetical protein